jgi:hypothetical protein
VLWAWAEQARTRGNEQGHWLIAFLRATQRLKERRRGEGTAV